MILHRIRFHPCNSCDPWLNSGGRECLTTDSTDKKIEIDEGAIQGQHENGDSTMNRGSNPFAIVYSAQSVVEDRSSQSWNTPTTRTRGDEMKQQISRWPVI